MGVYSTTTTLQINMPRFTFDAATSSLASQMITRAENEVNKYLSRRYDISGATFQTTTAIPPLVRTMTDELAEGYVRQKLATDDKTFKRAQAMEEGVLKNLALIADYKLDLLATSGSLITGNANDAFRVQCSTTDYEPTFNEDGELSQVIDPDKLDDIADARD